MTAQEQNELEKYQGLREELEKMWKVKASHRSQWTLGAVILKLINCTGD